MIANDLSDPYILFKYGTICESNYDFINYKKN